MYHSDYSLRVTGNCLTVMMDRFWISLRKKKKIFAIGHPQGSLIMRHKIHIGLRKKIISFFHCWLETFEPVLLGVEMLQAFLISRTFLTFSWKQIKNRKGGELLKNKVRFDKEGFNIPFSLTKLQTGFSQILGLPSLLY